MTETELLMQEAAGLSGRMRDIYRIIHQNPELGRQEYETSVLIERRLMAMGIQTKRIGENGIVGQLMGSKPGRTLALRAELDALPIQEETGLLWASCNPGVMHAGGHDFHIAALLGAAQLLAARKDQLEGCVKFFFQPNEEGAGGALELIQGGCMEDPRVDGVLALHCDSQLTYGTVSVMSGQICAASNPFVITLKGQGAHGAKPHEGNDVILAGAQLVTALQSVVSRMTAPTEPVVISVGTFHSGVADNVMDTEAKLTGIIRTMGGDIRTGVIRQFRQVVMGIAAAMGVEAEIQIEDSFPGVINDPRMVRLVRRSAVELFGGDNVRHGKKPSMSTDDFGYFSSLAPGCYFQMGTADPEWTERWHSHSPQFRISEEALPLSAALLTKTVLDFLKADTSL